MNRTKLIVITLLALHLVGCGVDKVLIKRGVNKVESNVVKELNEYADLTPAQNLEAEQIAQLADAWVRQSVLPRAAALIGQTATDFEAASAAQTGSTPSPISAQTYQNWVEFAYSPAALSRQPQLIKPLARFFFEMTPEQDAQVRDALRDNFNERTERRDKRDVDDQVKTIARFTGLIFRGLGAKRSRAQINAMREQLRPRIDLREQTTAYYRRVNDAFIELTQDKGDSLAYFTERYKRAWELLESGPQSAHPEEFAANAEKGYAAIAYLAATLNREEQRKMAEGLREYQLFISGLAAND